MNSKDALVIVFTRNAFYRRLYHLVLATFALMLVVIGILIYALVFLREHPPRPVYFATDPLSRLMTIIPVNVPNMTTDQVSQWTIHAIESATSYDYLNYHAQLQNAQKYFTDYGWRNYMSNLAASNNLLALTRRSQMVLAEVVDQPKLIAAGLLSGVYAWKFQMPLLVTYTQSPYDKVAYSNALVATVVVERQPVLQSDQGLGIAQFIATMPVTSNLPQEISATPTE